MLYESPNGDTWRLVVIEGEPMVRHSPASHSGGRSSEVSIGVFLGAGHHGPEHEELLRLIATLAAGQD